MGVGSGSGAGVRVGAGAVVGTTGVKSLTTMTVGPRVTPTWGESARPGGAAIRVVRARQLYCEKGFEPDHLRPEFILEEASASVPRGVPGASL